MLKIRRFTIRSVNPLEKRNSFLNLATIFLFRLTTDQIYRMEDIDIKLQPKNEILFVECDYHDSEEGIKVG